MPDRANCTASVFVQFSLSALPCSRIISLTELHSRLIVAVVGQMQWQLQFLPRDARSAKRGIATLSRPSVCLFVHPSVRDVDVLA